MSSLLKVALMYLDMTRMPLGFFSFRVSAPNMSMILIMSLGHISYRPTSYQLTITVNNSNVIDMKPWYVNVHIIITLHKI